MAEDFKKLAQTLVPNPAATVYTVPGATQTVVKHIRVVNPSGSGVTLTLWHDGTADTNLILPPTTVVAGGWGEFDGNITMEAGDTLSAQGSTDDALTLTVYGLEVT